MLGICFDRYNMETNDVDYYDFAKQDYVRMSLDEYKILKTNKMQENNNDFLNQETKTSDKKERKPRAKKEVIPVVEATEISPVTEDFIQNEIKKFNIADATIAEWKETYGSLTINGLDDKENYEIVNTARTFIKKKRIEVEKVGKEMRGDAIKFQKAVIAEEKRIIELIDPIETHLENEKKRIDDLKEQLKQEKELKEQAILQERAVKLIECGCNFTGDAYVLDDIRISVVSVKQSDAFTWSALFAAVETKFKENQEIKKREEELRLQAEAENKRILEETLARQEEIRKKEEEMAAREQAIKDAEEKAKRDAEERIRQEELALKRKAEEELARIEREKQEKIKSRMSALFAIGYSQQGNTLIFSTLTPINIDKLYLIMDESWETFLSETTKLVNQRKTEIEQERVDREQKIKDEAASAERKRIEDEIYADTIAKKEKAEAEEKERQRLAMLLPDEEKFNKFCKVIASVPVPEFTMPAYQEFAKTIKADVLTILKTLHSKKPL